MDTEGIVFTTPVPPEAVGGPPLKPETVKEDGITIERDLTVTLRDGIRIYADIYRPDTDEKVPAIVNWSPYGKQMPPLQSMFKVDTLLGLDGGTGVVSSRLSKYTGWEAPDPMWWCPRGFAIVLPDSRGSWNSEGDLTFFSHSEGDDEYDLIEWLAVQPWCNGKIGLSGVSYPGLSQWIVGSHQPPHLAAINVWEGFSDAYREVATHGGIPERGFLRAWQQTAAFGRNRAQDFPATADAHPLIDEYWRARDIDFSKITAPAFIVASWSDQGLHTRGTLEGYKGLGSKRKWLRVHGGKKWADYYAERNLKDQLAFFNQFLKGIDSGVDSWPQVRVEVRDRYLDNEEWKENEFPLARTDYRPLHLDATTGSLSEAATMVEASTSYDPNAENGRSLFSITFDTDTYVVGYAKLKLWIEARGSDDADLFVGLEKRDAYDQPVTFPFAVGVRDNGPVALGWLRASHRALDVTKTTPQQPWHPHDREELLKPGEVVPVEIEIWPSGTHFGPAEKLELIIQGRDLRAYPQQFFHIHETRNKGQHVIYTGGQYDSHLLLPFVTPTR